MEKLWGDRTTRQQEIFFPDKKLYCNSLQNYIQSHKNKTSRQLFVLIPCKEILVDFLENDADYDVI